MIESVARWLRTRPVLSCAWMRRLAQISIRPSDRQAVEAAVCVARAQLPLERAVLFGSKARGDDDAESDIDLLLLTARRCNWSEKRALLAALWPLERSHGVVFSLLIVPTAEWEHGLYQVLPLRRAVERDGIAL